jgi:hypothetical protein
VPRERGEARLSIEYIATFSTTFFGEIVTAIVAIAKRREPIQANTSVRLKRRIIIEREVKHPQYKR